MPGDCSVYSSALAALSAAFCSSSFSSVIFRLNYLAILEFSSPANKITSSSRNLFAYFSLSASSSSKFRSFSESSWPGLCLNSCKRLSSAWIMCAPSLITFSYVSAILMFARSSSVSASSSAPPGLEAI